MQNILLHPLASTDQHVLRFHVPANIQHIPANIHNISANVQNVPAIIQYITGNVQNIPAIFQNIPENVQVIPENVQNILAIFLNIPAESPDGIFSHMQFINPSEIANYTADTFSDFMLDQSLIPSYDQQI